MFLQNYFSSATNKYRNGSGSDPKGLDPIGNKYGSRKWITLLGSVLSDIFYIENVSGDSYVDPYRVITSRRAKPSLLWAKKGQQKVLILKKTTGLCPSRQLLLSDLIPHGVQEEGELLRTQCVQVCLGGDGSTLHQGHSQLGQQQHH